MLRVESDSWFSWDFTILDGEREVAKLDQSWWSEAAEMEIEGESCRLYREGMMGDFVLEAGGEVSVRAEKPSALRNAFVVRHGDESFELEKESVWKQKYSLRRHGRDAGSIAKESWATSNLTADLPEDLPLRVRVFMVWLVLVLWKRENDSAAGSGGGASG